MNRALANMGLCQSNSADVHEHELNDSRHVMVLKSVAKQQREGPAAVQGYRPRVRHPSVTERTMDLELHRDSLLAIASDIEK